MHFANNLKFLMDQAGLTNYQLAKKLNCHQSNIAYWLSGDRTPRKKTQFELANLFGVSHEALMNGRVLYHLGKGVLNAPLLKSAEFVSCEETKKPTGTADGQLPFAERREVLAGEGIRILLDADAKLTEEQLDDIVNFIEFQQRKHGR